jgi:hypothetical protein
MCTWRDIAHIFHHQPKEEEAGHFEVRVCEVPTLFCVSLQDRCLDVGRPLDPEYCWFARLPVSHYYAADAMERGVFYPDEIRFVHHQFSTRGGMG